jgi:hypothetical protein
MIGRLKQGASKMKSRANERLLEISQGTETLNAQRNELSRSNLNSA